MKTPLLSVLALVGCAGASVPDPVVAPDSAAPADMAVMPLPHRDMTISADLQPAYNPCVKVTQVPVTSGSQQAQMCLTNENCTDSLGRTYTDVLYDSCHNIYCQWKLACNNGNPKTFCLPDNEQSSPEYADDSCTIPIALVQILNGKPASRYVGLDNYHSPDGGFSDGGADHCVDDYTIGRPWIGDTPYAFWGGMCNPTPIGFPGIKLYFLSASPVDPSTQFVEQ